MQAAFLVARYADLSYLRRIGGTGGRGMMEPLGRYAGVLSVVALTGWLAAQSAVQL